MASETRSTLQLLLDRPVQAASIGVVVAAIIGTFAYTAGWLTPGRLGADRLTNGL